MSESTVYASLCGKGKRMEGAGNLGVLLDHVHGVNNGACAHPDCKAAVRRYIKVWAYERSQGRTRLIDATPARLHIAMLMGQGWSRRAISGEAGLGHGVVSNIARGQERTHPYVVKAILAVDPTVVPSRGSNQVTEPFVSRIGVVRRIQALLALGWTHQHLREHSGVNTALLLSQQGRWVTRTTHDKVAAAYRSLAGRSGPSERTRARALKLGYLSPAAWDDIDHDLEPDQGTPDDDQMWDESTDEAMVQRVIDGGPRPRKLTNAEAAEAYRRLRKRGLSTFQIENDYGLKSDRYEDVA